MENFYLVLVKKDGEIIHNTFAISHDDLIDKYIIPNDIPYTDFFRALFRPKDELSLTNVDEYKLLIQETFIPEWFDDEFRNNTIDKLINIIKSMIITTHKNLLLNEGVILSKTAKIDRVMNCIVYAMYDSSNIKSLCCNSQVLLISDESIIDKTEDNSRIEEMYGNALVNEMYGYSKIMKMHGNTKVMKMYNNSRIAVLRGFSKINEMRDNSETDRMKHMSKVMEMHNSSVIEEMWDWAVVNRMYDNTQINYMDDDSIVQEMHGNSVINEMCGNAVVQALYENSIVRKIEEKAAILKKQLE